MAAPLSILVLFMAYFCSSTAAALSSSHIHVKLSTISAAPAFLPTAPSASSPSLPPDIEPEFPTPRGMAPSPADSTVPTIPSSPSPPNPDSILAPAPGFALSPSDSLPTSASVSLTSAAHLNLALFFDFLVVCLLLQQLSAV